MFFMMSGGNFLMFYLGMELSAIPLAALVNFDLDKLKSSEAAMKLVLLSAFASGMMLYGISMLYGTTGTLSFAELPALINGSKLQVLALVFVFAGFAFKLSAVPFHLWTADVYEGAPVSVTAYLSVVSKAAIVFVLISALTPLFTHLDALWNNILYLSIVLTITVGNLFAMRQQNIRRFIAFSSIAQVGFILLGLTAGNATGSSSAVFFLFVYTLSNLGILGVVGVVSDHGEKENIDDFRGFYKTNPFLGWVMALSLFSLAGIPPTAGFFGKMFLVAAGSGKGNFILIAFAALNMVISLYLYLRIIKAIFVDPNEQPISAVTTNVYQKLSLGACVAGIVLTGFTSGLYDYIFALFP
jgi:NADH-quinone oxidoreductase subunit N